MKFVTGELVTLSDLSGGKITLRPSLNFFSLDEDGPIVRQKEVAIVIMSDRADCRNVQIIAHAGFGWVAGAFLKKLE